MTITIKHCFLRLRYFTFYSLKWIRSWFFFIFVMFSGAPTLHFGYINNRLIHKVFIKVNITLWEIMANYTLLLLYALPLHFDYRRVFFFIFLFVYVVRSVVCFGCTSIKWILPNQKKSREHDYTVPIDFDGSVEINAQLLEYTFILQSAFGAYIEVCGAWLKTIFHSFDKWTLSSRRRSLLAKVCRFFFSLFFSSLFLSRLSLYSSVWI